MGTYRIGIDVGGTFTDLALLEEETGKTLHFKVLSTSPNPADGVLRVVDKVIQDTNLSADEVNSVLHGTTITTNALLERRGARLALITTEGFRDVLEIGRQIRPSLFDWGASKPEPYVPRRRRFELKERVCANGSVSVDPDRADIEAVVEKTLASKPEAVAVSLLFSFQHPEHENRVLAALRARDPDLPVSLSSRVLPEYREFERTSTTVANAFTTPILTEYTAGLVDSLSKRGLNARLRLLQSNGGIATLEGIREKFISTALSGPAGGVTAAAYLSRQKELPNAISLDMGGTSSDICLIRNGRPGWTVDASVGGFPIRLPMMDIHTVGAGGGSVIWVDSGGGLRVGPQSAGSRPGPACYGFGGNLPTITDAHMEIGTLRPEFFEGKDIPVRPEAGTKALAALGEPLGMSAGEVAADALRVVNFHLAKEIRAATLARGFEASECVLIPFGGAGPLHACEVAKELSIDRILLPEAAGVLSALGAAIADFRYDFSHAFIHRAGSLPESKMESGFKRLDRLGREKLADFPARDIRLERSVDMRYLGQSFDINVPVKGDGEPLSPDKLVEAFHLLHENAYGFSDPDEPVEFVNLRLTALGITSRPASGKRVPSKKAAPHGEARIRSGEGEVSHFLLVDREVLPPGGSIAGPAILHDAYATAVIPKGWSGAVDEDGHILLAGGTKD